MPVEYIDEMVSYLKQFEGKTDEELALKFNVSYSSKQKNYSLAKKLMSSYEGTRLLKVRLDYHEINVKTIQLNKMGRPKESMSFAPIDFLSIVNESWDESEFKKYLLKDFIFFVFKQEGDGKNRLTQVFKWDIPAKDLEGEIKEVWLDTQNKLKTGNVIQEISEGKLITTFAHEASTKICHVRPHGASGTDYMQIPVQDIKTGCKEIPKQSFWFNHSYIISILNENIK